MTASQRVLWALAFVLLHGCQSFPDASDEIVNTLSREVRDPAPLKTPDATPADLPDYLKTAKFQPQNGSTAADRPEDVAYLQQLAAAMQKPSPVPSANGKKSLTIPPGLPGSKAPPIQWPESKEEQERVIQKLYPPLPPLPPETLALPGPNGRPLTLSDLQGLATANNPAIKNAVAGVEAARGAMKQAGAYPNPSVAWESDTVGTSGGRGGSGYPGAWIDQVIKGANDLKLKTAAARMDLSNAELALTKARSDVATQVRSYYFTVLVALENIKVSRALANFADQVYRRQVDLLRAGNAASYEPMQVRPLALEARLNLFQAQVQYRTAWKQLGVALGLPGMPPTELVGSIALPVPVYDYQVVEDIILSRHTDVLTALNNIQKARYLYELARIAPFPDFDARVLIQKDYTAPPFLLAYSGILSMTLPVWDLNRGNIYQTQNQVTQAYQNAQSTKLQLIGTLADAFARYRIARGQVQIRLQQVQDYFRTFRHVYERYNTTNPRDIEFNDVVTSQQTLVSSIMNYIAALGAQWTAVVDVANLLQTRDLFQTGRTQEVMPVPNLEQLLPGPCVNPAPTGTVAQQPPTAGVMRTATLLPPSEPQQTSAVVARSPDRATASDRRSPLSADGRPSVKGGAWSGDRAPTEASQVRSPARLGPVLSAVQEMPVIQSAPAAPLGRLELLPR